MQTGLLRHRVTYQTPAETTDAFGQRISGWQTIATYWAFVRPLSGRELENAKQIRGDVSHLVTLRRVGALSPQGRLQFRGRTLSIAAVLDVDEQQRELKVFCTEVVT